MGKHSMPKERVSVFDNTYVKTLSQVIVVFGTVAGVSAPAFAAPEDEKLVETASPADSPVVAEKDNDVSLTVVNADESKDVYPVGDFTTLGEVFDSLGIDSEKYRTESGHEVDVQQELSEDLTVYKYVKSGKTKKVSIEAPVKYEDSDDLFVGEERVESEGKDGEAVVTTVVSSTTGQDKASTEEKLTVVKSPKPKVVLKGTKERPASAAPSPTTGDRSSSALRSSDGPRGGTSVSPSAGRTSYSSTPSAAPVDGSKAEQVLSIAKQYTGVPYVWGGTTPRGWDCSGYTRFVYRHVGVNLPRNSSGQRHAGKTVSYSEARPGDIIWKPGHVGIYAGNGMMYDAGSKRTGTSYRSAGWMLRSGAKFIRVL